jgi:uncharacterized ion transporter superfamily protein YfcC
MPNTLVLIFLTLILTGICTYVIPGGEYQRIEKNNRKIPVANSFHYVANQPQGLNILTSPIKGFSEASAIIAFLLIIGGAFFILQETGAINAVIHKTTLLLSKNRKLHVIFIPTMMLLFSLGGAIFGMCEEVIPFVILFIPLAISLGYDSIVGLAIPFLGAAAGFAGAFFNPFTVGIAQGLAEIPLYSGLAYRIVVWVIVTFATIAFVMVYAARIHKNPKLSPVYELDCAKKEKMQLSENVTVVTGRHKIVLLVFLLSIVLLVVGILKWQWYIPEIAGLFLGMGIICGFAGGLNSEEMVKAFANGAKDMMNPVLVIACARAILVIATDGKILDTILYALASFISLFSPIVTAWLMFYVQCIINFFVHSGSGQAALTIPIMAPLSDLVGITRQTAVLAFQLCELINPILPTSGVTMGVLGLAGIPWIQWVKWMGILVLIYCALAMLLLIWPVMTHWV